MKRHELRAFALLLALALVLLAAVDASAAGRKLFITKYDENAGGYPRPPTLSRYGRSRRPRGS